MVYLNIFKLGFLTGKVVRFISIYRPPWCYGNSSIKKGLNTEIDQGNILKLKNSLKPLKLMKNCKTRLK